MNWQLYSKRVLLLAVLLAVTGVADCEIRLHGVFTLLYFMPDVAVCGASFIGFYYLGAFEADLARSQDENQ